MSRVGTVMKLARCGFPSQRPASPLIVVFHVTTRCNMRCRHCGDDVWGNPADDLPFAVIEQFSADLGPLDDLALGGGEPFLRSDFTEICALFVRNNRVRNLVVPTNGFATDRICAAVETILQQNPAANLNLGLSLDGFQATHDSIRMPGSFDQVMETARRLAGMRGQYRNLSFLFNATINNVNWRELPELAKYVRDQFEANLDFNLLSGNPRDSAIALPGQKDLEWTVNGIAASYRTTTLEASRLKVCHDVILRTNAEGRQIIPCRGGSIIAMVDANGDVRSCPMLPVLGNLRHEFVSEDLAGQLGQDAAQDDQPGWLLVQLRLPYRQQPQPLLEIPVAGFAAAADKPPGQTLTISAA